MNKKNGKIAIIITFTKRTLKGELSVRDPVELVVVSDLVSRKQSTDIN
jgi:hypothetical protein